MGDFDVCDLMYAKDLKKFFANLIQMLTSEARIFSSKAGWVQGRSPGGGCGGWSPCPTNCLTKWIYSWKKKFFKISKVFILA